MHKQGIFGCTIYQLGSTLLTPVYGHPTIPPSLPSPPCLHRRLQLYYRQTSREVRRLDSTLLSPVYSTFAEVREAAPCVRGLGLQSSFMAAHERRVAAYQVRGQRRESAIHVCVCVCVSYTLCRVGFLLYPY